jgi:hypothetical protein
MYGSEVLTLSKSNENNLAMCKRKTLKKKFGPLKECGICRTCTNQQCMNLYKEPDIISEIIRVRSQEFGRVVRMPEERIEKEASIRIPRRKRVCWKAKKEMVGHVENDMKKMGTRGSTIIARKKYAWKLILKEAKVLHGS